MNKLTTDEILTKDAHLIQSWANLNALKQDHARTAIVAAEGAYVTDSEGNRLIDGIGGLWCVNVGHGRREIIDAITEQLNTLDYYSTFYNFTHPAAAALAEKIASLAPGPLNHVHFGNSGSVANDSAVRMLHHYNILRGKPSKKLMLSPVGAYHGSTMMTIALTTPGYSEGWSTAEGLVHHLRSPNKYREAPELSDEEFVEELARDMEDIIHRLGADNIAGFFAEPIMGAGGVIAAPRGYQQADARNHDRARHRLCRRRGGDGLGRLGHMFASQDVFDHTPDIITTAKGLTSGYQPLSATIVSDQIHDVISGPDAMFLHG
ncbi:MAG: aminotransferase class III-fold pyridoxal phosphate-dependent enzyme [Paracoccaceae bacterium]